jgi:hypothetical protein
MLHTFGLGGRRIKLWQAAGESYEHVLMKALAYSIFVREHPDLQIEVKVGLRYKPDLIAIAWDGTFDLWVECGMISITKTAWLAKHTTAGRIVICKIDLNADQFVKQLRTAISSKYRPAGRISILNFVSDIRNLTATMQIAKVSRDWYTVIPV